MAGSVNKVILVGRLGKDPEFMKFQNGNEMCEISLATSERWKDKQSGETRERTEWHTVKIHNEGLIRVAREYLNKGDQVYIEGRLETREWQDKSGAKRYSTEVALRPFSGTLVLTGGRRDGSKPRGGEPAAGNDRRDIPDDDIPF